MVDDDPSRVGARNRQWWSLLPVALCIVIPIRTDMTTTLLVIRDASVCLGIGVRASAIATVPFELLFRVEKALSAVAENWRSWY